MTMNSFLINSSHLLEQGHALPHSNMGARKEEAKEDALGTDVKHLWGPDIRP